LKTVFFIANFIFSGFLIASEATQDKHVEVVHKKELSSVSAENDPIKAFDNYLSLMEDLKAEEYKNLKIFVTDEAMMNMNKYKNMMGFYFAMVNTKSKAGLYKNGKLSINNNEAKIIYVPVEYQDFKSGKKIKTGATIYMVKVSNRWLFHKEKGFTKI